MRKNLLKSILFLVLSFLMAVAFAGCDCKGCKSCNNEEGPGSSAIDLYFSSDEINLTIDESRRLDVFIDGVMQNPTDVTFGSENPNVVLINDAGEVTGYALGSAYVTATVQGATTKCMVNIDLLGLAPEIVFINADYDKYKEIAIPSGDELDMAAQISFDGKLFDDAVFKYEFSDKSLGSINGTKFMANKSTGELQIFVMATWRGVVVEEKIINVVLTNSLSMTVNGQPFSTINTTTVVVNKAGVMVENKFDLDVEIKDRVSEEPLAINIVLENQYKHIISYNTWNSEVTTIQMGTAYIDVYLRRADGSNGAFLRNIKIVVSPYIFEGEKAESVYLFDAADGIFDVQSIFGEDVKIAGAEFIDRNVKIDADAEGRVLGITTNGNEEPIAEYVNVYTSVFGYRLQIKAYGKIIDSPEDILWFNFSTDGKAYDATTMNVKTLSGYYIMTEDIDMSQVDYASIPQMEQSGQNSETGEGKFASVGFKGTFDGQGHSIYNMKGIVGGIFGVLNGTVKDVAFKNVSFDKVVNEKGAEKIVSLFASRIFNSSLIENVYINVANVESTSYGVLSNIVSSDIVAKNLVVVLNTDTITANCSPLSAKAVRAAAGKGFSQGSDNPYNKMENVIVVSGIPIGTARLSENNIYTMEASNITNLEVKVPFKGGDENGILKYSPLKNATIVRFNSMDELASNKDAISGILDKFRENENWLVTEDGKIYWGNGESLYVNGNEGVSEINLYLENDYGFDTEAVVKFLKDSVDYTDEIEITASVDGIVSFEGNVIKAEALGYVEVFVGAQGSALSFVIHVREALDSAVIYANVNGKKADTEYAGEVINLYYKEGEDISANNGTFIDVVLNLEGKEITEGFTLMVKEGLGTSVDGNKIFASGKGESIIVIDCGRGVTFEIAVKTTLWFNSDDLTGSEDFPADWLSGLGK